MHEAELELGEHRGLAGLDALESDWRRLAATADVPQFHHDFDWYRSFLVQGWMDPDQVRFVVGADGGGRVRMICPVEQRDAVIRRLHVRVWALAGSGTDDPKLFDVRRLATGCDILCDLPEAEARLSASIRGFLRAADRRPSLLLFGRVVPGSTAWRVARAGVGLTGSAMSSGGFYRLRTDRPYDHLMAACSRNFRANLRKARNRIDAAGEVEREVVTSAPGLADAYDEFLRIESSGWKGEEGSGTAVTHLPRVDDHLRNLLAPRGAELRPEVHLLRLDGECIAAQFWLRYRDQMILPKAGYDEAHARLSPGHLHLQMALRACCEDDSVSGVNFVSDTGWVEPWKPDLVTREWFYLPIGPGRGIVPLGLLRIRRPSGSASGARG